MRYPLSQYWSTSAAGISPGAAQSCHISMYVWRTAILVVSFSSFSSYFFFLLVLLGRKHRKDHYHFDHWIKCRASNRANISGNFPFIWIMWSAISQFSQLETIAMQDILVYPFPCHALFAGPAEDTSLSANISLYTERAVHLPTSHPLLTS